MSEANIAAIPTEPPLAGDELDTLIGSLERTRRTLAWKCGDLDAAAMARRIGASAITLGGLVRHLTVVEAEVFAWKLHDEDIDSTEGGGWAWSVDDDVDELWRQWHAAVARSRELIAAAVADGGLDRSRGHEFEGWGTPSLRRLMIDMIEEYARHTGHADLIREAIDGQTGE
jgi:hypothetical protein